MNKSALISALRAFIRQRPGLEFGNYGDIKAYRAEMRSITRDMHHALTLLDYVAWHDTITAEMILDAAKFGRLSIVPNGDGFKLDYCTGQYFPTEYRRAACAVLSSAIWGWLGDNMPEGELVHNSETGETFKRYQGMRAGDYLRKAARRELGRPIASRFFN